MCQDSGMSPESPFQNGYGMASACAIDDVKMRFGATQTNPRHRQQLQTRVYHGHPHYEKGVSLQIPRVASIHTEGTRTSKPCVEYFRVSKSTDLNH
jgi:hypothetical protein